MLTFDQPGRVTRLESIHAGNAAGTEIERGIRIREFVSNKCDAVGFSTGLAIFEPGTVLPYHVHTFSEAITIISGEALVSAEGRTYRVGPMDSAHMPRGIAHRVVNPSASEPLIAHTTFGSAEPSREFVEDRFEESDCGWNPAAPGSPEFIARFQEMRQYELAEHTNFRDLFAARLGAVGICGGYGKFGPGTSLPCHTHEYDESITIVEGRAVCMVEGRRYELSGCDTAFIPAGRPHRFLNQSDAPMAMIWVYAGGEPDRAIVNNNLCAGIQCGENGTSEERV